MTAVNPAGHPYEGYFASQRPMLRHIVGPFKGKYYVSLGGTPTKLGEQITRITAHTLNASGQIIHSKTIPLSEGMILSKANEWAQAKRKVRPGVVGYIEFAETESGQFPIAMTDYLRREINPSPNGRSYAVRGVRPSLHWQPSQGDKVYIEGVRTRLGKPYVEGERTYFPLHPAVRGTTAMWEGNLKAVAFVDAERSGPTQNPDNAPIASIYYSYDQSDAEGLYRHLEQRRSIPAMVVHRTDKHGRSYWVVEVESRNAEQARQIRDAYFESVHHNPDNAPGFTDDLYTRAVGWEYLGSKHARLLAHSPTEVLGSVGPSSTAGYEFEAVDGYDRHNTRHFDDAALAMRWVESQTTGEVQRDLEDMRARVAKQLNAVRSGGRSNPDDSPSGFTSPFGSLEELLAEAEGLGKSIGTARHQRDEARAKFHQDHYNRWLHLVSAGKVDVRHQLEDAYRRGYSSGFGGRFSNPDDSASAMYETFHGTPSTEVLEVAESVHYHEHLATLGELVEFKVATVTKKDVTIDFKKSGAVLASNEEGTQLYVVGGDQSIDLAAMGFNNGQASKDKVLVGILYELTYRTAKGFHKFKPTDYYHELGEETGNQPSLIYDTASKLLEIAGGEYKVEAAGIIN